MTAPMKDMNMNGNRGSVCPANGERMKSFSRVTASVRPGMGYWTASSEPGWTANGYPGITQDAKPHTRGVRAMTEIIRTM